MFAKLTEFAAPRHRELAEFLQGCSADASTRTIATTALVLTLWQMAGRHMTSRLPSMLLLNAGDAADPIDVFIGEHATGGGSGPKTQTEGAFAHAPPELARTAMIQVDQNLQPLLDEVVGLAPLHMHHDPDAAGVVFKLRIVEPLLGRKPACHVTAVLHNNSLVSVLSAAPGNSKPAP